MEKIGISKSDLEILMAAKEVARLSRLINANKKQLESFYKARDLIRDEILNLRKDDDLLVEKLSILNRKNIEYSQKLKEQFAKMVDSEETATD